MNIQVFHIKFSNCTVCPKIFFYQHLANSTRIVMLQKTPTFCQKLGFILKNLIFFKLWKRLQICRRKLIETFFSPKGVFQAVCFKLLHPPKPLRTKKKLFFFQRVLGKLGGRNYPVVNRALWIFLNFARVDTGFFFNPSWSCRWFFLNRLSSKKLRIQ